MKARVTAATLGIVRLILRLHPAEFRRALEEDLVATLHRQLVEASTRGPFAHLTAAAGVVADAALALVRAPRSTRRREPLSLALDVRVAWRHLRAGWGTAVTNGGTLTLALAAAVVMFAVVEAALLRPLPFPDGDQLVRLEERTTRPGRAGVSIPAFDLWRAELRSLESLAFYEPRESTVTIAGEPERLPGAGVSREFFSVLGVAPTIGRTFTPGARFGPPDEAVISQRLFERLGGRPDIIGSTLAIAPHTYAIVGVMPAGFSYPMSAEFWVTTKGMGVLETERSLRFLEVIGRLQAGASIGQLHAELAVVDARHPATDRIGGDVHMAAFPLRDAFVGAAKPAMRLGLIGVALLLLVTCCNISALILARVAARGRTLAVHRAMGASPFRVARQCAFETLIVAVPACLAGCLLAAQLLRMLVAISGGEVPGIGDVRINLPVAFFAAAAAVCCALAASIVPSLFAARVPAMASLHTRDASASRGLLAALRGLVVAQVALGFAVAVCGALLARSVERLATAEHGFDPTDVAVVSVEFPIRTAAGRSGQIAFYSDVRARVGALPGVTTAGFLSRVPMSPALSSSETNVAGDPTRTIRAVIQSASPGALPAIGARFISGGDLPEAVSEEPSVVINDELARVLFPSQNAVDGRVTFTFMGGTKTARVAGVIRAVRYNGLSGELLPMITIDYRLFQFPMFLVARAGTDRNADTLLPELRALVRGADATHQVTVARLTTLDREVARVLAQPRFFATVMGGFSIVVVAIAAAGIFGLLSFWVSQRRRELGIRLALGAPARSLLIGVASRAVVTVGVGIAAGAALAIVVTRSMTSLLFEVGPADPISFAVCSVLFVTAAIVAAAVPARRAGRLDPLTVLRVE